MTTSKSDQRYIIEILCSECAIIEGIDRESLYYFESAKVKGKWFVVDKTDYRTKIQDKNHKVKVWAVKEFNKSEDK